MPAIAALTIDDGQTVPASHTFSPVTTDGSTAKYADRSPSIPAGFRTISYEVSAPSGTRVTNKIQAGFNNPTVATVDSVDKVVRNSSAQVTLNIHPESTLQERKDLLAYVVGFFAEADIKTSVQNIEPVY
jgi:hypothetical protein